MREIVCEVFGCFENELNLDPNNPLYSKSPFKKSFNFCTS